MVADTRAILRALKATPGPAPASSNGQYGTVTGPTISPGPSPLVQSYDEWTSGRSAGTGMALPRDPFAFLSGMFGPLAPIRPVPIDTPEPGEDRPDPRRFQYPIGWDMPMGMPGTEGLGKLADFSTLRTLADLYSVARACIELRKSELRGIGWDIALTRDAAKSLRGDRKGMADFSERRAKAVKFFRRPDPRYPDFSSWFDCLLEEVFVTDALALYVHPSRQPGKGLLGSHIGALDLIDGSLIRPLVDIRGGVPVPPNVAYQQYEFGVPRVDLMTLLTEDDDLPDEMVAEYRGDQLLYLPFSPRTWTPYGMAPIERAIIPVMTGLNKQQFQLNFYQEGSIPGLFVSPGDATMTPQQIRELQDALNALAGDQAWKHKIIVLPGGSKVDPQKPVALADQFDEIVMTQVCMAFSVMPMELGISPRVSATQTNGAANQMAKASQDIQERKGTVPLLMWMKAAIFDRILQDVCGQEDLEWQWEGLEEDEDAETLTNLLVQQISAGMRSIDEARQELGLDPWNIPATADPGWASQMNGFVPFAMNPATSPELQAQQQAQAAAIAQGQQAQPGQPPAKAPGQPAGITTSNGGTGQLSQSSPPKALPPGQNRPATSAPRGAGTRNSPAVAGTPAHAAAQAGVAGAQAKKPVSKSVDRELGLLRNHLRKGGTVAGWVPQDLPGAVLAAIEEDLTKGLTVDEVCDIARGTLKSASEAFQDRGEPARQDLGIDGTAGDAQDIPHPFTPDHAGTCIACGRTSAAHKAATEVTGHGGHADLTHEVYAYLARHYPASVLEWVKEARWHGPVVVPLDHINMARRNQSARNPAKVQSIAEHVEAGGDLAPVVLVDTPGQDKLQIADGWHRTLALQHAGRTSTRAWIGQVSTDSGPWDGPMNAAKLNKAGDGGADPKAWPGWAADEALAGRYATRIREELLRIIPVHVLARAWLDGQAAPAMKARRHSAAAFLTAAGLAAAISAVLKRILADLWAEGNAAGTAAAAELTGTALGADEARLQQLIDANAVRADGMASTRAERIAQMLDDASDEIASGGQVTEDDLAASLEDAMAGEAGLTAITQTEVTWSMAEAALGYYYRAGVTTVMWQTDPGSNICPICVENEEAGWLPVGEPFPGGMDQPPQHPRCRCALIPGQMINVPLLPLTGPVTGLAGLLHYAAGQPQYPLAGCARHGAAPPTAAVRPGGRPAMRPA
jgi:Phage portal protein/ParB-like nuclease domain